MVQFAVVVRLFCCWKILLSTHQTKEEAEKTITRKWWHCLCFPCISVKVYNTQDLDDNLIYL